MRSLIFIVLFLVSIPGFASRKNKEVLGDILNQAGPGKVVIFDLDDTVINAAARKLGVIHDFANLPENQKLYPRESAFVLERLRLEQVGYDVPSTQLAALGLLRDNPTTTSFLDALDAYWLPHVTHNESYHYDLPNPGAVSYVNAVFNKGAVVVYLTGRKEADAMSGTLDSLKKLGFPLNSRAFPFLKDEGTYASDAEFKVKAISQLKKYGQIVAFFDNEPVNDLLMKKTYPEIEVVFLNTNWEGSDMNKLVKEPCIFWLSDFIMP